MQENLPDILLRQWALRLKRAQLAHRFAAKGYSTLHLWMGIPAVVLATVVATSVFASWEGQLEGYGRILTGMLSVGAAIFAALQTFLRFEEKSEKHQMTDARYGAIRQKIEQTQAFMRMHHEDLDDFYHKIRREIEELSKEALIVPERFWQQARRVMP